MMGKLVKVIDRGWNKIEKGLKKYNKGKCAAIGIQGSQAEQERDGATNVLIGSVHEFGSSTVPERSFMRSTFDENKNTYQTELDKIGKGFFSKVEIEGELLLLGEKYRRDIINKIRSGIQPPLKDETVKAKAGVATPLYRTGQMINATTAIVVDRESKSDGS